MSENNGRGTKNLGLMKAIHVGVNPPLNTKIIWYNDNTEPYTSGPAKVHYYYNVISSQWEPLHSVGSGSGNFGYIAYSSNCEGADFALVLDENVHTHWALVTSNVEIQQNQLIPSLFIGRWTSYCTGVQTSGGNYTYVGYAVNCKGDNFSTVRHYTVPCLDCEKISSSTLVQTSENITHTDNADGTFDITFTNAIAGSDGILLDLKIDNKPLIDFSTYCIKVERGNLQGIVLLNLDTVEQGSFFVSGASESEEKFIDKNDGGSKLLITVPTNKNISTINGTIKVTVGTEGCCDESSETTDCIAYRNCFSIITSEEPIETLTVDLFADNWICNCCDCSNSTDDPKIKNIEVQIQSLNDFVKYNKIDQEIKIDINKNDIIKNDQNLTNLEQELLLVIQNIQDNYNQQISNLNQQIADIQQINQDQSDEIQNLQDFDTITLVTPTIEQLINNNNNNIQSDIQSVDNELKDFIANTYNVNHSQVTSNILNIEDKLDNIPFNKPL